MKLVSCPPPDQLRDFSSGRLAEEATETLAEHLDECPTCRDAVAAASQSGDPLVVALREPLTMPAFSEETDYRRAMDLVEAIGRDPETAAGLRTPSPRGQGSDREEGAFEPASLGSIREYQLQRKLGEGGMGAVYQALHTRLDKLVAIKVLPADRMRDAGAVARFQREMKAVGKLDHPNIVRAMDAGEENGLHYLVMEYVPGVDLAYLSRARGPLPIADACELVRQAALGLAEAHEHGMVHRDIKPSNLILAQPRKKKDQPIVKILDLGLALLSEALSPDQQGLTSTGQMMGTIDYMAPEQGGDSHKVDIRADLYSLGATLYKLLTGEAPFAGEKYDTPVKKLMALATQAPRPVCARREDVPGALASLVENLLAKDPDERLATPEDVAEALEPFCRGADLGKLLRETAPPPASVETGPRQAGLGTQPSYSSPSGDTAPTIALQPGVVPGMDARAKRQELKGPRSRRAHAAQGGRKISSLAVVASGCGCAALLLLGTVFFIQTSKGTVQIEINDPAIQVMLNNDGEAVIKGADKKHEIKVYPGTHGLTITRGDFSFHTTKFELKRREVVALKVEYLPGKVRVATSAGDLLGEKSLPAYALQFDGVDDYVELPTLKFDPAEAFTMEIWVNIENPEDSKKGLLLSYSGAPGRRAKLQFDLSGLHAAVGTGDPHKPDEQDPYVLVSDSTMKAVVGTNHFAVCWSPDGNLLLYANGKRCPDKTFTSPLKRPKTRRNSMIGAHPTDSRLINFLKGRVHRVRFSKGIRYASDFSPAESWEADADTIALYQFDEGGGEVLYDTSGNGHHGKIVGASWTAVETLLPTLANNAGNVAASIDYALEVDGAHPAVTVDSLVIDRNNSYTIEAFVTPTRAAYDSAPGIVGVNFQTGLFVQEGSQWLFASRHGDDATIHVSGESLKRGQTAHLAAVRDGSRFRLFVDGKPVGEQDVADLSLVPPREKFSIGSAFFGRIDEVRVSKVARYQMAFDPQRRFTPDADTLALYHCDEGQGDELKDSSGNGHHGKIVGAKWANLGAPTTGAVGESSALAFDQDGQYAEVSRFEYDPASPLTVEAIVQVGPPVLAPLVALRGAERSFALHRGAPGDKTFGFAHHHSQGTDDLFAGAGETSAWRHVCGVWDGRTTALFIDGKKVGDASTSDMFKATSEEPYLLIGGEKGASRSFRGKLRSVRISASARYAADFVPPTQLMDDAETTALYDFTKMTGDVLTDSSGNGHHGKIVGAKWVREEVSSQTNAPAPATHRAEIGITREALRPFRTEVLQHSLNYPHLPIGLLRLSVDPFGICTVAVKSQGNAASTRRACNSA